VNWVNVSRGKVHTPNQKTIDEVSAFLKLPAGQLLKSLLYITQSGKPVMACLRGDHELSEEKLNRVTGEICRAAEPEEALKFFGTPIGFLGPIGLRDGISIFVDRAVDPEMPFATGALESDYHITGYTIADIKGAQIADLRQVANGDLCEKCGNKLNLIKTIEIGHIFKLGTKYSKAMGATFLDENGEAKPIIMGSYGIGVGRILAAAIELYGDADGICWPISIAPYEVVITAINVTDEKVMAIATDIYDKLRSSGVDVLFDDRDMQAGAKFKDADMIGMPIRVTVGRGITKGVVEIFRRKEKSKVEVPIEKAVEEILKLREELFAAIK
jgi:prolyl-tRNA synthetase